MDDTIAFIGGGNMAMSLISGLVSEGGYNVRVSDPMPEQLERYEAMPIETLSDNNAAVAGAGTVVLAVKPQVASSVLQSLQVTQDQLIVSIAAGIGLASMNAWTDPAQPIVRCMPNTPALLNAGITALYANEHCSAQQRNTAETILTSAGKTLWVDSEGAIDAVTAVSGSGPAYFFALMEAMADAGVSLGLSRETATELAIETAYGAALMAQKTADSPATLRQNVTSPGGTTQAALEVFAADGFAPLVERALTAAAQRSKELAEEFGD